MTFVRLLTSGEMQVQVYKRDTDDKT